DEVACGGAVVSGHAEAPRGVAGRLRVGRGGLLGGGGFCDQAGAGFFGAGLVGGVGFDSVFAGEFADVGGGPVGAAGDVCRLGSGLAEFGEDEVGECGSGGFGFGFVALVAGGGEGDG